MSTFNLDRLLAPGSIALVGASPRSGSLGRVLLNNLRGTDFAGPVYAVNPRHGEIDGLPCFSKLTELPTRPDLAVIATPVTTVPDIIAEAAELGVRTAAILTAGLGHGPGSPASKTLDAARQHGLRLVGPNCLGVIVPRVGLNASFAAHAPPAGELALLSQSGAVAAAMVEQARGAGFGFSALLSLGDMIDVDFGDCLDMLAADAGTRAILLYVEAVTEARKFMSAARAAARTKPVIVVKSGRHAAAAKAAATHTGALAGADDVHEAAFRRAGLVRATDLNELIAAAVMLARPTSLAGDRLAILTNGGGLGVLAVDRLLDLGGRPAELSEEIRARLDAVLPPTWSRANPVDIIGDADAERYRAALEILLEDNGSDAVLAMNVPTGLASAADAAAAIAGTVRARPRKPVIASWLGADVASAGAFAAAGIPRFTTEADAVRGFIHLVRHRQGQERLQRTPPALPEALVPDARAARRIVEGALSQGRTWLDPLEVQGVLSAYRIPAPPVTLAATPEQAERAAAPEFARGGTVALKIHARGIIHKSDVHGVELDLASPAAVREAFAGIVARTRAARPEALIHGVTVQPMIRRRHARELLAGIALDPTFGPIVLFGAGGVAVELLADRTLELPPLDMLLAHDMIAQTRIGRLLEAYRNVPAADAGAVATALVQLSLLAADLPEIAGLDLNPLLADADGVIVLDARIELAPASRGVPKAGANFAIRPYPREWERRLTSSGGIEAILRPLRPEDERLYPAFVARVSPDDLHARFMGTGNLGDGAFLARLTQLDYARAMAIAALDQRSGDLLGVLRLHTDADHQQAEFALLVRSDLKGRGLGRALMALGLEWARSERLMRVHGLVSASNTAMLALCREFGFVLQDGPVASLVEAMLPLETGGP